jgi:hypothetical protein
MRWPAYIPSEDAGAGLLSLHELSPDRCALIRKSHHMLQTLKQHVWFITASFLKHCLSSLSSLSILSFGPKPLASKPVGASFNFLYTAGLRPTAARVNVLESIPFDASLLEAYREGTQRNIAFLYRMLRTHCARTSTSSLQVPKAAGLLRPGQSTSALRSSFH